MDLTKFRAELRVLEREIERQLLSETGCCGVSLLQCHVLLELAGAGELSLKSLEERIEADKAALSRTVDALVREGLAVREQDEEDRRYLRIKLSNPGVLKVAFIEEVCGRYYEELFKRIPKEKHASILEAVELLGTSLRDLRKSGDGACCMQAGKTKAEGPKENTP